MSGAKKTDGSTKSFVEYKAELNTSDTRVAHIASAGASAVGGSLLELSENQKRWIVTGICLNKVVTPRLRKYIKSHMTKSYKKMKRSNNIDRQTFPTHLKNDGKHKLNYAAINNNQTMHGHTARLYDYKVTSPVDMAKLYLQTHMAKFSAFDESCDPSAVLGILCAASCFSSTIQTNAQDVRANVRNKWAHCNFADWTEFQFLSVFQKMEVLVRSLGLAKHDTDKIVEQLNDWMTKGVLLCMAPDVDKDLLKVLYEEVSVLAKYSVDIHEDTKKQLQDICRKVNSALQEFERRLVAIEEDQKVMGDTLHEVHTQTKRRLGELEEKQGRTLEEVEQLRENQVSAEDKITGASAEVFNLKMQQGVLETKQSSLETDVGIVKEDITDLKEKVQSLDDKIKEASSSTSPVRFQAPNRNEYFSGRERELHILQDAFDVSKSSTACNKVFGISGLGGCGKTTLAAEYSWRCRSFYTGGVFWISAESETLFRNTMIELAFTRDTFDSDFDQCFRATLASLSRVPLPFLLVVDNADELKLSDNVRKLLSGHWMRESPAHVLVTTRRKAEELQEVANIRYDNCVTVECLSREEAITFVQKRTSATHSGLDIDEFSAVTELVDELGGLPLALEQAGSHIKALKCTYSQYLEEFKKFKMTLIQERKAKASSEEISKERLAVHTTWLMNFEQASQLAKESGLEELTSVVIDVSAYLSPDDIPCDIINQAYSMTEIQEEVSPVVARKILDILTKFSLFQSKSPDSFSVHRLVQQVIQSRCPEGRREEVLLRGVRMLNFAFRNTNSPTDILSEGLKPKFAEDVTMQDKYSIVTWARLASHAVTLKSYLIKYVSSHLHAEAGPQLLYAEETANVLMETAVYLSMSNQQKEAYESQNFMMEILTILNSQELNVYPVNIPLTDDQQRVLRLCSKQRDKPEAVHDEQDKEKKQATIDQLHLYGNKAYTSKDYMKAVFMYSKAIEMSETRGCKPQSRVHVLYCNRSQCYLKLEKPNDALRDADDCIKRDPHSFKGFLRRALAMKMLFDEGKEEYKVAYLASAAMAIYLNPGIKKEVHSRFGPAFYNASYRVVSSQEQWNHTVAEIKISTLITSSHEQKWIVLLESGNYELDEVAAVALHDAQAVFIGVENVKITNAHVVPGPGSCQHFENILFDKANFVAYSSFVSCMGCIFQNGKVEEIPKCLGNNCPGCLVCHSGFFSRNGNLKGGPANLQALEGSKIFLVGCNMRDSAGGAMSANDDSFILARDCKLHNHCLAPLEAKDHGSLIAEGNEIFDSKFAQGVCLGPAAGPSVIRNNKIHSNTSSGIQVLKGSNDITIEGNEIYQNGEHGIMQIGRSSMVARKNDIFENWFWGLNVLENSTTLVSENVIHNNKCGGMRIEGTTTKVVVCRNKVTDHNGPGILTGEATMSQLKMYSVPCPSGLLQPVMIQNTETQNVEGQQHPTETISSLVPRCVFCYRTQSREKELSKCASCYKASYCNKICQTQHWRKHKGLCKALKDKFSVLVDVPHGTCARVDGSRFFHPDLKKLKKVPKPDRHSTRRFIVKVQTLENVASNPNSELVLYDQSTDVDFRFTDENIYHIIIQCGVLGCSKVTGKKIFCYASFEERGKKLRIYLNELAPFQEW